MCAYLMKWGDIDDWDQQICSERDENGVAVPVPCFPLSNGFSFFVGRCCLGGVCLWTFLEEQRSVK